MAGRVKSLTVAVSVTILDAVVLRHYGFGVWRVLAGVIWIRLALLIMASIGVYSLIDIWAHTLSNPLESAQAGDAELSGAVKAMASDFVEGADV